MKYTVYYFIEKYGDIECNFKDVEAESADEAKDLIEMYLIDSAISDGYTAEETYDHEIYVYSKNKVYEIYSNFKAIKRRG